MESPKIFFAHLREMTERFDPRYVAFRRRTAEFRYPMVRLSELLSALPEYGAGEAGIERTNIKQPRYIRITDINDDGELSPELGAEIIPGLLASIRKAASECREYGKGKLPKAKMLMNGKSPISAQESVNSAHDSTPGVQ